MFDVKRLIAEVSAQNGIRLEPDDPAFALVTLNQLVLEGTANRVYEHVSATLAKFTESISKTEHLAGKMLAQEVKTAVAEIRMDWAANFQGLQSVPAANNMNGRLAVWRWLALGSFSATVLFVAGFALGRMIGG